MKYSLHQLTGLLLVVLLAWAASSVPAFAAPLSPPVLGGNAILALEPDTTLMEVAVQTGVGFQALQNANPEIDPWTPLPGMRIRVPKQALFPGKPVAGLTINLAELRLYYLPSVTSTEGTFYPLGIGRQGWETPEGDFQVVIKREKPIWRVPSTIKAEHPELPDYIPAGPHNPLGDYWLGLSAPGYGLHGTNRPQGVGRRVSHGCIRLYDQDIASLYECVETGTRVQIIYQPGKAAQQGDLLLLEVHPDYLGRYPDMFQEALTRIAQLGWNGEIDYDKVLTATREQTGIPVAVGQRTKQKGSPLSSTGAAL